MAAYAATRQHAGHPIRLLHCQRGAFLGHKVGAAAERHEGGGRQLGGG